MTIKSNHLSQKALQKIWQQVPKDYYDQGIKNNLFQKLWHQKKLAQVLKLLPQKSHRVLDIGCASGILTAQIAKALKKAQIAGLDSYSDAITYAQSKYPHIKFVVGDAHQLPFKNNSFDLIICTETLEHLVSPPKALQEIKRVLKKNGQAIISMDSGNLLFKLIWYFWTKTRGRVWQNAHLHEFNTEVLEDLIRSAGFKIKKKIRFHLGMAVIFLAIPQK